MRQNAVTGGNHGDLDAQLCKGGDELGAGHAGTDDDEVLRQLGEVVDLLPGKDALAIRLSAGENARGGAGGYQDEICVNGFLVAVLVEYGGDLVAAEGIGFLVLWEIAAAIDNACAQGFHGGADIGGLLACQILHALIQCGQGKMGLANALVKFHILGTAQIGFNIGTSDEGLGRNTVQDNAVAAHALVFNNGDFCTIFSTCQRCLIAGWAAADDDDSLGLVQHAHAPLSAPL